MSALNATAARYRFGDGARAGVLLGLGLRQALPLVVGTLWLTLWLMVQLPLVGMVGPLLGMVASFGRWRRAPLYDVAAPGARLTWQKWRSRRAWVRRSLLAAGPGFDNDVPAVMAGLELLETAPLWPATAEVAVVHDRKTATVSMVVRVTAAGFSVASAGEQDALVGAWGGVLAPLARARCPVSRVTWQEWCHPVGVAAHRSFLANVQPAEVTKASADYDELLAVQDPTTIAHEVLVTVTVDLRRVRAGRTRTTLAAGLAALSDETRLLCSRIESAGMTVDGVLSARELPIAVRLRSDPGRARQLDTLRSSLAAAVGKGIVEWGPMAVEPDWFKVRVDGSVHRTFRIAGWPMLPVTADWMAPLLNGDTATRTVTVVMEPVPLTRAAQDANRQLTSIEADQMQKERHGFRLTAREKRRRTDVEAREQELVSGHPEFRHVGFVTVTAPNGDELEDAAGAVEQSAAQAMVDLRPLAARQAEGWLASLPLGRSVRSGAWS
jgi:hypothetical protein